MGPDVALAHIADNSYLQSPGQPNARGAAFACVGRTISGYLKNDSMQSGGFNQSELFFSADSGVERPLSPIIDFVDDIGLATGLTPEISSEVLHDSMEPLSPLLFDVSANQPQSVDIFHFEVSMDEAAASSGGADAVVPAQEPLAMEEEEVLPVELPELPTTKKRKKQVRVPENKRDAKYLAYRAKNTAKAKAIRDRKRVEKQQKKKRLETALARSAELRAEVERLEGILSRAKATAAAQGASVY